MDQAARGQYPGHDPRPLTGSRSPKVPGSVVVSMTVHRGSATHQLYRCHDAVLKNDSGIWENDNSILTFLFYYLN